MVAKYVCYICEHEISSNSKDTECIKCCCWFHKGCCLTTEFNEIVMEHKNISKHSSCETIKKISIVFLQLGIFSVFTMISTSKKWKINFKMISDFLIMVVSLSTIHGFNHITKKGYHPVERLLWISLVTFATYEVVRVSQISLERYRLNPTVISMERDRFSFNTSFPSITICPQRKLDEKCLEEYLGNSTHIEDKKTYRKFINSLLNVTYENLDQLVEYEHIGEGDFIDLIEKFTFKFKPILSTTIFSKKDYLQMSITDLGVCYSLNSQLAVYNSPDYWKKGSWELLAPNDIAFVNPMDGEVFAGFINLSTASQIYLHGPYEVADVASKSITSKNGHFLQLYVKGLTIFTSNAAKSLTVNQRKCRMYYESNLRHSPVYSYVLCRMECRAKLAKRFCGCTPHFYRKIGGEKSCDIKGLKCLHQFKDQLIRIKEECSCLPNCEETHFFVDDWDSREWFLGTVLQWGLKEYPKMRLKRDIIFGFSDLLVYTGGLAGLFLGCSVLSFIEIFYFLTLRFYWFVTKYRNRINSF